MNPAQQLRATDSKERARQTRKRMGWKWAIVAVPVLSVVILSVFVQSYYARENARRQHVYSELADLHVATLASATPVDVVSTDRHTVKPWFAGKDSLSPSIFRNCRARSSRCSAGASLISRKRPVRN